MDREGWEWGDRQRDCFQLLPSCVTTRISFPLNNCGTATAATAAAAAAGATSRRRAGIPRCFRRLHLGGHLFSRPGHGQNLGPGARYPPGEVR